MKKPLATQIVVRLTHAQLEMVDIYRNNLKARDGKYKITRERAVRNLLDEFLGIAIKRRHL